MRITGLFLVCLLILSSCKPAYVRKGFRNTREERERLMNTRKEWHSLDTSNVRALLAGYYCKLDTLHNYKTFFETENELKLKTQFNLIGKPLEVYLKRYVPIDKEFKYSLKQITNLEKDLKNKLLSREQFRIYYTTEKDANDKLIQEAKNIIVNAKTEITSYQDLEPKVDSLILYFREVKK